VVVVAIGAVVYFMTRESAPDNAAVGDCIKVNSATISNADVEKIECTSPEATYKVGATFEDSTATCPGGDNANYISYTQSGRGSNLTLCLILNAKEGDCFEEGTQVDTKVECGAANATFQVLKVLTNTADDAQCPEGTQGSYVYPEPKPGTVQCLVEPGANGGPAGT
jgi:hypothetical protein